MTCSQKNQNYTLCDSVTHDKRQCAACTSRGERCKRFVTFDHVFCSRHRIKSINAKFGNTQDISKQHTSDYSVQQISNTLAAKDQEHFYMRDISQQDTHDYNTSPQNSQDYCIQQDSKYIANVHQEKISEDDSFTSEQEPPNDITKNMTTNHHSHKIFSQQSETLKRPRNKYATTQQETHDWNNSPCLVAPWY